MIKKPTTQQLNRKIYLDYAATTPIDEHVLATMLPYFDSKYGNPSSMHSSGRRATQVIARARKDAAMVIGSNPDEIIFTGSGTESDNLAIKGVALANRYHGNHIIISAVEHKAVLESAKQLEKDGFEVSIIPVDPFGLIDIDACVRCITEKTILVSVMYANNEIGTIEPITELSKAIHEWRQNRGHNRSHNSAISSNQLPQFPLLHTDACQAAGALSLNVNELGVDLMSLNSSKIYGPKGVGLLYKKRGIALQPLIVGGEQENMLRAGTESVPLIVGFVEALLKADAMRIEESKRLCELRDYCMDEIVARIDGVIINGHRTCRLPNNIHISIPFIEGESILLMLDNEGVEASTGSACSAFDLKPSHVLTAIGQSAEFAHGSIRFSLGRSTTKADIDRMADLLSTIVERLSGISALTVALNNVQKI